jgi:hypothetical protein
MICTVLMLWLSLWSKSFEVSSKRLLDFNCNHTHACVPAQTYRDDLALGHLMVCRADLAAKGSDANCTTALRR